MQARWIVYYVAQRGVGRKTDCRPLCRTRTRMSKSIHNILYDSADLKLSCSPRWCLAGSFARAAVAFSSSGGQMHHYRSQSLFSRHRKPVARRSIQPRVITSVSAGAVVAGRTYSRRMMVTLLTQAHANLIRWTLLTFRPSVWDELEKHAWICASRTKG